ncbi:unnamed protein product [Mytilus coruscus]|uniref:Ig-like domain-containing protein n=1 Tax=Mytilus coruscus TaxID=42192 RepID=A0A6J8DN58_MYTCO|nr:unnamed protein product [Mytilus coruscus]
MNGKISFFDQHNQEQAKCAIPYSSPKCISYYPNRLIEQNVKLRVTSLVIRGDVDHHLNGNWSCHLGQNIESAFTYVRILNTIVSNNVCKPEECQCSEDGKTYFFKYEGFPSGGTFSLECRMEYGFAVEMSACKIIEIIDIDGPYILQDHQLPFLATDTIELVCYAATTGIYVELEWDCLDFKQNITKTNSTFFKNSLSFHVRSSMHNRTCTCKAAYNDFTVLSSLTITVSKAPVLNLRSSFTCNLHKTIELTCYASSELPVIYFESWVHSIDGYFIRQVNGNNNASTSTIYFDECNYEDEGEYLCQAWTTDHGLNLRNNISGRVVTKGPPIIIDEHIYRNSALVLSVKMYSVSPPILMKWFVGTEKLVNSTSFAQTFAETMIQRQIHGTLVTTNGFTANLTIPNISNEHFKVQTTYSFFVKNEFGNMTKDFVLDKTGCNNARAIYFAATSTTSNVYDVPDLEMVNNQTRRNDNDNVARSNRNENLRDEKETNSSEDGYEIPHDYIDVF